MTRNLAFLIAALTAAVVWAAPALAGETTISWEGNGSENLPCAGNEHWVLSPAQGITSATLTIDGVDYTMTQSGDGSFSADTDVGFDGSQDVSVTYVFDDAQGDPGAHLQLSHCESGQATTGGTTTGGTTTGGTTTGGTTTGGTTTGGTTGGATTGGATTGGATTGGGGVSPATTGGTTGGGTTGGTTGGAGGAQAAGELPFTGLPVWIPLLAGLGLLGGGYMVLRWRVRTSA
jgi:hypothetical protein